MAGQKLSFSNKTRNGIYIPWTILLVTMNLKKVCPTFPVISKCHKITWQITIVLFLDLSL